MVPTGVVLWIRSTGITSHLFLLQGTKLRLQPSSAASAKSVFSEWMTRWPLSLKYLTGEVTEGEGLETSGCLRAHLRCCPGAAV